MTSAWRRDPDYIVIGAQKCGTASLFAYLAEHPQIRASLKKEISYFNTHFEKGETWYRAFFPLDGGGTRGFQTGEATPDYIFDPRVPARLASHRPQVKLIALLRDPVDRAFSHYRHNVRKGNESRSFEDALRHELDVLEPLLESATSPEHRDRILVEQRRWFYLARGRYHEQLRLWMEHFPQRQLLVLRSEDLFRDPAATFSRVLEFLGLRAPHKVGFEVHNGGRDGGRMAPETERWLRDYFHPHNQALEELLGGAVRWARPGTPAVAGPAADLAARLRGRSDAMTSPLLP